MLALTDKYSFTVKDIPAGDFIKSYADYLKKNDKVEVPAVRNTIFSHALSINSGSNSLRPERAENSPLKTLIGFTPELVLASFKGKNV